MEQTYTYSSWIFTRAISLIYLIAFLSLMVQARGLWGSHGILPIAQYKKAIDESADSTRYWKAPSIFWLSTSDDMIVGVTVTGAIAATLALVGFAQGWSLLLCFAMYLSLVSFGQEFLAFQWDTLLLEVGFLALFVVPWNLDFAIGTAIEPHWIVRGTFYVVLFKLMFLSGAAKLLSGDESWRDLTALSYHYWTQPLPNPLSPFMYALPLWVQQASTALTFALELVLPFFMLWPRARVWVALGFTTLSLLIMFTGNFAFFNLLTLAMVLWLIPDSLWEIVMSRLPFELQTIKASMFPHPGTSIAMVLLMLLSVLWCTRNLFPDEINQATDPILRFIEPSHISNSYGLFANMTKNRPEIVIEGSLDGRNWKEYEFKFKAGNVYRHPAVIAPLHPRLDWQMWFAAALPINNSPWVQNLLLRLFENSPDVLALFDSNPFAEMPPKYLRAKLYSYEFATPEEILDSGLWWKRTALRDYSPVFTAP